MEELFEMPVSVTATLLIRVWAGGSESQRRREPNKKKEKTLLPLCLPGRGREVCSNT